MKNTNLMSRNFCMKIKKAGDWNQRMIFLICIPWSIIICTNGIKIGTIFSGALEIC